MVKLGAEAEARFAKFSCDSTDVAEYRWAGSAYGGNAHIIRDATPHVWQEKAMHESMCGMRTPRNGWGAAGQDDCRMCYHMAANRGMTPESIKRAKA